MAFFRFQDLRVYQRILEFARLADAQVQKEPGMDGVEVFPPAFGDSTPGSNENSRRSKYAARCICTAGARF